MDGRFVGKVAIVTGGTQGLGEAIARRIAREGAKGVVITGRHAARGDAVAAALQELGSTALFVTADLAQADAAERIVAAAAERFGRIDHLVNAAAITDRGTLLSTDPELYDRMFTINVRSPFFLMQGAVRCMIEAGVEGSIVNILSMSAHGGQSFLTAYSASKAALAALTKNAAFSLLRNRIRVNGLNLGWMDTPGEDATQKREHGAADDWLAAAEAQRPFGRLIKADEAAGVVAFLLSADSGLMSGALLDMDQQVLGCAELAPAPERPLGL